MRLLHRTTDQFAEATGIFEINEEPATDEQWQQARQYLGAHAPRYSSTPLFPGLQIVTENLYHFASTSYMCGYLQKVAHETGGHVIVGPEYFGMPLLMGQNDVPVFVYQFVDALDGIVDYDDMLHEYPELSYNQIYGTFQFIRRILQFNTAGLNVADFEDQYYCTTEQLVQELREAMAQGEPTHVLGQGE